MLRRRLLLLRRVELGRIRLRVVRRLLLLRKRHHGNLLLLILRLHRLLKLHRLLILGLHRLLERGLHRLLELGLHRLLYGQCNGLCAHSVRGGRPPTHARATPAFVGH